MTPRRPSCAARIRLPCLAHRLPDLAYGMWVARSGTLLETSLIAVASLPLHRRVSARLNTLRPAIPTLLGRQRTSVMPLAAQLRTLACRRSIEIQQLVAVSFKTKAGLLILKLLVVHGPVFLSWIQNRMQPLFDGPKSTETLIYKLVTTRIDCWLSWPLTLASTQGLSSQRMVDPLTFTTSLRV